METEKKIRRIINEPLKDKDTKEILWRLYQDNYVNARHHESQRSTVTNFIILIAGGISTIVSVGGFTKQDLPLALLLVALGIFGALFSLSHYERYKRSKERAKSYLRELDFLLFKGQEQVFKKIKRETDSERKRKHPKLHEIYDIHVMWISLPLMVAILGLVLTVMCFWGVGEPTPTKMQLVDGDGKPLVIGQNKQVAP
ncbi:MAG: hypothetical protein M3384_01920 [Acidobacteriota bacterium]|nr:hypothetical protein [Acidobacteriota bacterium]